MTHHEGPEWFHAKRYGWGAGLPCAWQGWALLLGYALVAILSGIFLAERSLIAFLAILVPLTLLFVLIASRTTRGGAWRWRWGKNKDSW
ncbi:hypothetical protein [Sphingomicrobium lutaoense]|uniref:Uncharacterized protein n=1 Tax=Sphingomicrobium lutaoense TaxID=515949 RepID=A0A839Z2N0_9SPHN|nr:hypothetical protein [Sphingomicrobium lutaoense]MBB3764880.1 hypothetical protein [Sphingomicrobium lutaoense]